MTNRHSLMSNGLPTEHSLIEQWMAMVGMKFVVRSGNAVLVQFPLFGSLLNDTNQRYFDNKKLGRKSFQSKIFQSKIFLLWLFVHPSAFLQYENAHITLLDEINVCIHFTCASWNSSASVSIPISSAFNIKRRHADADVVNSRGIF